jgi:transcriptional regulator with XRE-family HTH domain
MEDDTGDSGNQNPLAEAATAAGIPMPAPEELAGRLLRLLRLGRGWSQREVADRMNGSGYNWRQSTIGKLEAGQRPLRVNELADLARLFGIPVTELLEPHLLIEEGDDLSTLEADIGRLEKQLEKLEIEWARALEVSAAAQQRLAAIQNEQARTKYSLEIMRRWLPGARQEGKPG